MAVYVDPDVRAQYESARQYYVDQGIPFADACRKAKAIVLSAYSQKAGEYVTEAKTIFGGLGRLALGALSINNIDTMLGQCVLDDLG